MKRLALIVTIVILLGHCIEVSFNVDEIQPTSSNKIGSLPEDPIKNPLYHQGFIQNDGQWSEDRIEYYGKTSYGYIAFTLNGIIHFVQGTQEYSPVDGCTHGLDIDDRIDEANLYQVVYSTVHIRYENSDPISVHGLDPQQSSHDFIRGSDSNGWYRKVPSYGRMVYEEIYEGIDLIFYYVGAQVKYEFTIDPYANASNIQMTIIGSECTSIRDDRYLSISTIHGEINDGPLLVHYDDAMATQIPCEYVQVDEDTYRYSIDEYDVSKTIIIDPLVYSTHLGGHGSDFARNVQVAADGTSYIVGSTYSADFPLTDDAIRNNRTNTHDSDIFITVLSADGRSILYSTLFGGETESEQPTDMILTEDGDLYIVGNTWSSDFPTTEGAYQEVSADGGEVGDGFIVKINTQNMELEFSTLVSSDDYDGINGIDIQKDGTLCMTGSTNSANFPTTEDAIQREYSGGYRDGIILMMSADGERLVYSSYIGGSSQDFFVDIAVDGEDNMYVTGWSRISSNQPMVNDFPTTAYSIQPEYNGGLMDGLLCKVSRDGSILLFSTFIGGEQDDKCIDIELIGDTLIICGETNSSDFPTTVDAVKTEHAGGEQRDGFLLRLSKGGSRIVYSTLLGGDQTDDISDVYIHNEEFILITGETDSDEVTNFPCTPDAIDNEAHFNDVFIIIFRIDSKRIEYCTLLGGYNPDTGSSITVSPSDEIVVVGYTGSSTLRYNPPGFPTTDDCLQPGYGGNTDGIYFRISHESLDDGSKGTDEDFPCAVVSVIIIVIILPIMVIYRIRKPEEDS